MRWSDWLYAQISRTDSIALVRLMELLFTFLMQERELPARPVAESLARDYRRGGRRDPPEFLRPHLSEIAPAPSRRAISSLKRQSRHLAA